MDPSPEVGMGLAMAINHRVSCLALLLSTTGPHDLLIDCELYSRQCKIGPIYCLMTDTNIGLISYLMSTQYRCHVLLFDHASLSVSLPVLFVVQLSHTADIVWPVIWKTNKIDI